MKTAMLPVIGAVAGTLIGGPVGLAAGLKIGGMVAVGGSIAGEHPYSTPTYKHKYKKT